MLPARSFQQDIRWLELARLGIQLPDTESMKRILAVCGLSLLCFAVSSFAQSSSGSSGTVRGSVLDPSGAAIASAAVEIRNPVSGYSRTAVTDNQGKFQFDNLPYNPYHVTAAAPKFPGG